MALPSNPVRVATAVSVKTGYSVRENRLVIVGDRKNAFEAVLEYQYVRRKILPSVVLPGNDRRIRQQDLKNFIEARIIGPKRYRIPHIAEDARVRITPIFDYPPPIINKSALGIVLLQRE